VIDLSILTQRAGRFSMWRHQAEWALLGGKRCAVHHICDNHFGFENPRIKFC
jgi:hypothetical protein